MPSLVGQLEVSTSSTQPVETKKKKREKNGLAGDSEYKQIIAQTGLPANARHSLGVIGSF